MAVEVSFSLVFCRGSGIPPIAARPLSCPTNGSAARSLFPEYGGNVFIKLKSSSQYLAAMSAVPGSTPGRMKRSLAELLASRARKADGKAEYSSKRIQEAAVYLLSCHQDANQFLLEIADPPCKKICDEENSDLACSQKSALLPDSFVGSTLRDQASHLGIPADVLGARAAVTNIQQICRNAESNAEEVLLSQDQRDRLTSFLKTLKVLMAGHCFRCSVFLREIWQQARPPVVEVVWHLHSMDIMGIEDILESCRDVSCAVDWFCKEMRGLCLHVERSSSQDFALVEQMISNLLAVLIGRAFCRSASSAKSSEQTKMTEISRAILDSMLSWLLDAVVEAGSGQTYKPGVQRHWLIAYNVSRYRARVIPGALEEFFLHTLSQTLTYKPKLKVSDAIRFQANWSFVKTCPLLMDLYRKLFVLLNAGKLTSHVQSILDTQEVNWHHVLSFFSCLVICQSEAQNLLKDLLNRLLSQAFETYELEYLITAFLIARQAALEGPAAFMSYTDWFKGTFGSSSSHQSISKKSLVFLLKFLSDLVPFEAPQYLKVHILHSPFVPTKFRSLLMEYITLAKTRLSDMKVSIEDMGLYEDLSVGSDKDQPQSQALQDVEKAVKIFKNTGKIPASVMEASIFRRPYFTSRFLPALLNPRVLPPVPDSLMLLIDSLKRADKIPANMLSSYLDSCELEKHRKLEGNEKMDVSMNEEPVARLQAALWELRQYVTDGKRYDEVSSQVAVISDRLGAAMGAGNPTTVPVTSEPLFSCNANELEPQELTVSDLLLTSFCQSVMAASSTNPPDRQGPWPTLYVKMLFGHRRALFALLTRTLQLLCHQAPVLKDAHLVGLAAFSVHLHECRMSLAPPGSNAPSMDQFWAALLNPQCSGSLPVVLRFCTAAISYACCRFSLLFQEASSVSVPPQFMQKVQHLLPRLILETRREGMVEEETDTPVFSTLSLTSIGWKEAALSLWRQTRVQELFKKDLFQLSFRDWLLWEISLNPDADPLSDMERQDYQRWAVNQCFLPEAAAIDGCENSLENACSAIVEAVLDFSSGSDLGPGGPPSQSHTGLSSILSRLQELVCDFLLSYSGKTIQANFLLDMFHRRLGKFSDSMETGPQLRKQCQLTMCCRIILGLPSSLLVRPYSDRDVTTLKTDDFYQFVNKHLKNISQRGYALHYDLTAHFFRGLLSSSAQCEDAEEAVNSALTTAYTHCPIIMTSAALWWPQLDAAIRCQWACLYKDDLPKEIETLKGMQADVDRFLSQGSALPLTNTIWLSAAFLHFSIQRNKVQQKKLLGVLGSSSATSLQLLDCLLFFSIIDLIPLTLTGGAKQKAALESCIQTIQCLEGRGGSWLTSFQLKSEKHMCRLHQVISQEFLKLLPLAFFSLAVRLSVESVVKQQDFLAISLEMYSQLFRLFMDGSPLLDPLQTDPQTVFSKGRQFLLSCILKGPHPSAVFRSHLPQFVDFWDEKDPELAGLLQNFLQNFKDDCMYDEPDLFQ